MSLLSPYAPEIEEDGLPFGPAIRQQASDRQSDKTPLLLEIARVIRDRGGSIWSIEKGESSTLFRLELATRQFRVLVPTAGQVHPPVASPPGSPCYLVQTLSGLDEWLLTCTQTK